MPTTDAPTPRGRGAVGTRSLGLRITPASYLNRLAQRHAVAILKQPHEKTAPANRNTDAKTGAAIVAPHPRAKAPSATTPPQPTTMPISTTSRPIRLQPVLASPSPAACFDARLSGRATCCSVKLIAPAKSHRSSLESPMNVGLLSITNHHGHGSPLAVRPLPQRYPLGGHRGMLAGPGILIPMSTASIGRHLPLSVAGILRRRGSRT